MTQTPVEVLPDAEGEPVVFVDPDQITIAEDQSAYGCGICGEPLIGNMGTLCSGEQEE
jgi:hypothetical protein